MKEPWSISKDKLIALEEGTSCNEEHECAKPAGRNDVYKQAIQCVKLFLHLGLLIIVGWACYSIWQPYHAQSMQVKVMAIIREPESQNLLLLEEQSTHETSTIADRPVYGSEDSKRQDAVDDLQKFSPDYRDEILNSETTESSLGWPTSTDYPDLPRAMNFPFFSPSFSSMKVDENEKEPGSSESAQGLFDISIYNLSEESQQLEEDEKILLKNYMLLSLLLRKSVRISKALEDSKEVVDPKFELKLEDFAGLDLQNSDSLELEYSSRLELDNSGPLQWFSLGQLESQKEIGSDLKDSAEKTISTQTDDNYGSATLNILNNTHEIIPEDSTEPEQEETLIKTNKQIYQSVDSIVAAWFDQSASEDRKHEKEQSLLEKSTVRNAEDSETLEDSTEEVDHNFRISSEDLSRLELEDSGLLEMEDSGPLKWEHSSSLESQKEIDSDLEDSEEKTISTQTDDNYGSATLNILNNSHEIIPEDSTKLEPEETLIKTNKQIYQSIDSIVAAWFDQSASEDRKHEEEQATDETETEIEDDEIPPFPYDFRDSIENTYSLGLHSDTGGFSVKTESDKESESDSFDGGTYKLLLNLAQGSCIDTSLSSWKLGNLEDTDNSYGGGVPDMCNERTKAFCKYAKRTLKLADCSKYNLFRLRSD